MPELPKQQVITLVITDGIFGNKCDDSAAYVARLKLKLAENKSRETVLVSVVGNRGICDIDSSIEALDLDTKNKTQFTQSMENNVTLFDELLIIKSADDMFLSGARQTATELNKPFFMFGYARKTE